jgi:hypothetical protein
MAAMEIIAIIIPSSAGIPTILVGLNKSFGSGGVMSREMKEFRLVKLIQKVSTNIPPAIIKPTILFTPLTFSIILYF